MKQFVKQPNPGFFRSFFSHTVALRSGASALLCMTSLIAGLCLAGCSRDAMLAEQDQREAMGHAHMTCDGVSGNCLDFSLGDRHAISLPADRLFVGQSANLTPEALQTLSPIARSIHDHAARWVSIGVWSRDDDQLTAALSEKQAQVLVSYFTRAHLGTRMIYQNARPVDTVPGLAYFTDTTSQVPHVKIEYGV